MNLRILEKTKLLPPLQKNDTIQYFGYHPRTKKKEYRIILHSTNGLLHSSFISECNYLLTSPKVSSHFLIGKQGQVIQFFENIELISAWHAGSVINSLWSNENTIGIETHYTPGESEDLPLLRNALDTLITDLVKQYKIADIEMHRTVASPIGRKRDPSWMNNSDFYSWREYIRERIRNENKTYKFKTKYNVNVRTSPTSAIDNIARHITIPSTTLTENEISSGVMRANSIFWAKKIKGQKYNNNDIWLWDSRGIGFIWSGNCIEMS